MLLQQFLRENPRFYATPGDWDSGSRRFRPALLPEPGDQHFEAGESFVARLTTRIGARARECGAVRSDTKAEAFRKRVLRDRRLL